eukprot:363811-Chlamydomonas_euryale.AAC.12
MPLRLPPKQAKCCPLSEMQVDSILQRGVDVVLMGEYHDDPVAHELQLRLLQRLSLLCAHTSGSTDDTDDGLAAADAHDGTASLRRQLVLSLEQFETDTQTVMDEYLAGLASEADLARDARAW